MRALLATRQPFLPLRAAPSPSPIARSTTPRRRAQAQVRDLSPALAQLGARPQMFCLLKVAGAWRRINPSQKLKKERAMKRQHVHPLRPLTALQPLTVTAALCLAVVRIGAFPVITNVVETGGDGAPFAQFTGQTFTGPTIGTYTVPLFGVLAKSMADRLHAYTNASGTVAMPPYLVGQEYIMIRNDNRDNANLQLVVGVATAVRAYLLIDNRVNDSANGNPPTLTGSIIWVVNDGWTPVTTGLNRAGSLAVPDEVGIDESADGSINQWFSVYSKDFPAGTFVTGPQAGRQPPEPQQRRVADPAEDALAQRPHPCSPDRFRRFTYHLRLILEEYRDSFNLNSPYCGRYRLKTSIPNILRQSNGPRPRFAPRGREAGRPRKGSN